VPLAHRVSEDAAQRRQEALECRRTCGRGHWRSATISGVAAEVQITLFTDPACPFAFSAEPVRLALRWRYGDALAWRLRMIVLTLDPDEGDKLAEGAPGLQRRYGMPIAPHPYSRPFSSEPACRAVVAAREYDGQSTAALLLRGLRVRSMAGGLLDDERLIRSAATEAGVYPTDLRQWMASARTDAALRADIAAARDPSPSARALDHKLGGARSERRYTAPSYELSDGERPLSVPGFNPAEVYETAIANLAPQVARREPPADVSELLSWAEVPLATAEVVAIMQRPEQQVRDALARVAKPRPAGADMYWSLGGQAGLDRLSRAVAV
jgi:predicted DsbA family dithiol-disulfide isomerase